MVGTKGYFCPRNFHWNQAVNFVLQKFRELVDSDGKEGQIAYCDGAMYMHNGVEWVEVGSAGRSDTLVFDFSSNDTDSWTIEHNLGKYVTVQTMDENGVQIFGTVTWSPDLNSVTVDFSEPTKGTAIIGYANGSMDGRVFSFTDSDTWVINHNLGRYVGIQTMTSDGKEVFGTATWDTESLNKVTVTFSEPISGTAFVL